MYGMLDISTSGMIAQRTRLEVIQANIANQDTIRDTTGKINPYRRRIATLAPGDPGAVGESSRSFGVHVQEIMFDPSPARPGRYAPGHPDAWTEGPYAGYIARTNIDPVTEQINALEAQRAYEANVAAAEATKQMIGAALRLIA